MHGQVVLWSVTQGGSWSPCQRITCNRRKELTMNCRKPALLFVPVLLLSGLPWLSAPALAGGDRVQVCHTPPGEPGNFQTITISENALEAHLAHGDLPGSCDANAARLCDDGNACTVDAIDPTTGKCAATHPPVDCNDSDLCTDDTCDSAIGCVNAPVDCNDLDACTTDGCDSQSGCSHEPVNCDDNSACTTDTCDSATGCVHTQVCCSYSTSGIGTACDYYRGSTTCQACLADDCPDANAACNDATRFDCGCGSCAPVCNPGFNCNSECAAAINQCFQCASACCPG